MMQALFARRPAASPTRLTCRRLSPFAALPLRSRAFVEFALIKHLPNALTLARLILAPVIAWAAWQAYLGQEYTQPGSIAHRRGCSSPPR